MQQLGVNLGPTRANMVARGQLGVNMYIAKPEKLVISLRREHDFYEIVRFTVDTLWKALGMPGKVLLENFGKSWKNLQIYTTKPGFFWAFLGSKIHYKI